MGDTKKINFSLASAKSLRRTYNNALDAGKKKNDVIVFEGNELVLSYAYYVLEYLAGQFKEPDLAPKRRAPE
jgi:hypothetical protein